MEIPYRIRSHKSVDARIRIINTNQENPKSSEEVPDRFLHFKGIRPKWKAFGLLLLIIGLVQVGSASSQAVDSVGVESTGQDFSAVIASNIPDEAQLELASDPEETAGFVISELSAVLGSGSPFIENEERGPITRDTVITYTIKEGDTLSTIAEQFGISVNTILWSNDGVNAKALRVGTDIAVLPISGASHTVSSGDNLSYLAKKYKVSTAQIREYNDIDGDTLVIGQKLIIPGATVSSSGSGSSSSKKSYSSALPSAGGYFIMPTKGYNWGKRHDGNATDIANSCGTDVYAAAAGTVEKAGYGWNGGYGTFVKIKHENGSKTLYSHLGSYSVSIGQWVAQGEYIGEMGSTGKSTGCHLHFLVEGMANPFIIY
ncbi:MAG: peptidoglycan DD-metalloendopeptidase family protein [bacterium]|nr:peptidoglycan DD-metalloendopeptidase family protein [bacterium]